MLQVFSIRAIGGLSVEGQDGGGSGCAGADSLLKQTGKILLDKLL